MLPGVIAPERQEPGSRHDTLVAYVHKPIVECRPLTPPLSRMEGIQLREADLS
jgi:hypothetical protein